MAWIAFRRLSGGVGHDEKHYQTLQNQNISYPCWMRHECDSARATQLFCNWFNHMLRIMSLAWPLYSLLGTCKNIIFNCSIDILQQQQLEMRPSASHMCSILYQICIWYNMTNSGSWRITSQQLALFDCGVSRSVAGRFRAHGCANN